MTQLYLYNALRKKLKSQIQIYRDFFVSKLFPTFDDIEGIANKYSEELYDALLAKSNDPEEDGSSFAETAIENGISHYEALSSVRYSFASIAVASLYHMWEQQAREFLFRELSQHGKMDPKKFCPNGMEDIKAIFVKHKVNLTTLKSWNLLNELRLVCNVVKHGDGNSASDLLALNPKLFNPRARLPTTSSLLEETLLLSSMEFSNYANNLVKFWDEIPERSFYP